jgi:DNA-binding transcriptional LysR family regulator
MDRFHLMTAFVAVVDAGGFAGAARKLSLSPPAITRAVAALEQRLDVRLLTRTTRVVRVTDAGARYVEDCRRILAEIDEADESAGGVHATPRGRVTVTAPVLFGTRHVTPVVTEYLRRYPETSAACWFVDRIVNMVDEGVDVAVRIGELPDSSAQAIRVGIVRRVICAAPAYLERHGMPQEPDDLQRHTIIAAAAVTPASEWRLARGGAERAVRLAPRLTTTTNDAAIAAALDGFGLTRLLSYQVADRLADGTLVAVLPDYAGEPLPVHVVHREGRQASRKVRALLDLAIERLRANPALA